MSKNKVLFLVAIFALTSFNIKAQEFTDIGLFAGTSYYMGDLNPTVHYKAPAFAIGPILRYNFNNYTALRAHVVYHTLSGAGTILDGSSREFQSNLVDLGLDFEFNWKAYRTAHRKTKASPYVFAGLGYSMPIILGLSYSHSKPVTIPFGFGYKINLGKWLSGGFEMSGRKVFSDEIDGVRNPAIVSGKQGFSGSLSAPFANRDWIFFTGVIMTYKFYKLWEDCPTYDNSHKY